MRDDKKILTLLKTARGQIDGIIKMLENGQYCIDISNQILACQAVLNSANKEILTSHLHSCVISSIKSNDANDVETKMDEIVAVLNKLLK